MRKPKFFAGIAIALGIGIVPLLAAPAGAAVPTARNDTATTKPGARVVIDVLANDTPGPGDAIAKSSLNVNEFPSNGDLQVTPDYKLAYTPVSGFNGVDSFSYLVCGAKNAAECSTGRVSVTVGSPTTTTATVPITLPPTAPPTVAAAAAAPAPSVTGEALPRTGTPTVALAIIGAALCGLGLTIVRSTHRRWRRL